MNFKRNLTILISTILIFSALGCVSSTNVTFYTDAQEAEVYVDGELIGSTPATAKLSNGIWNDPTITIKKDGYKTLNTSLQKEVKTPNIVLGILLNWPAFLWCYGPKRNQNFILTPDTSSSSQINVK